MRALVFHHKFLCVDDVILVAQVANHALHNHIWSVVLRGGVELRERDVFVQQLDELALEGSEGLGRVLAQGFDALLRGQNLLVRVA